MSFNINIGDIVCFYGKCATVIDTRMGMHDLTSNCFWHQYAIRYDDGFEETVGSRSGIRLATHEELLGRSKNNV